MLNWCANKIAKKAVLLSIFVETMMCGHSTVWDEYNLQKESDTIIQQDALN